MKLRFKHQKFQADAAKAVCDVFAGQPYRSEQYYNIDPGNAKDASQQKMFQEFVGWRNEPVAESLSEDIILDNINKIQRDRKSVV